MRFPSMNSFIARERLNWRTLRFLRVGLGDSSYEFFCKTGKDFDNVWKSWEVSGLLRAWIVMWILMSLLQSG